MERGRTVGKLGLTRSGSCWSAAGVYIVGGLQRTDSRKPGGRNVNVFTMNAARDKRGYPDGNILPYVCAGML